VKKITITTRKSILAQWQANEVARQIKALSTDTEVEVMGLSTEGDRRQDVSLSTLGGKGVFVKELETVLLSGDADIAVHSMKDVPAVLPEGLEIAAVLPRADPRDALVSNSATTLEALPASARIGTSSLRRSVQLKQAFPGFRCEPLRGNVDTRLACLDQGDFDAIILATHRIAERIPSTICLPSAGQGAVGIEIRSDRPELRDWLAGLNHQATWQAVSAEREIIHQLSATCNQPVAVHFEPISESNYRLSAFVSDPEGQSSVVASAENSGDDIEAMIQSVTQSLIDQGARALLATI
jgi:hydroxymethylbilane synthase